MQLGFQTDPDRIGEVEFEKNPGTYSWVMALSQWLMLSVCRKASPDAR